MTDDPFEVLGVSADSTPEEIRAAYVRLVELHPPDRDPEQFERIRDAYRDARDPRARARARILGPEPLSGPAELVAKLTPKGRAPAGLRAWLDALREASRR